jgi:hypothetical protein
MTNTYNIVGGNHEGNRPFWRLVDLFDLFASLFNGAVGNSDFTTSDDWIVANNESKRMLKEVVIT